MLSDEMILVTGFPGFIAGRLVAGLAAKGARFLLLVHPAFSARAREDVARIARETDAPASHFQIIEGDITKPQLGLAPRDAERAQRETRMLFHLAAIYDLAVARETAMRVNVEGTRNVNRFAQTLTNLRRYHYVSTCYVAGKRTGLILETELEHDAGFNNYYEETKYLAELEVEALKNSLPITIHRPAVVCGDSRTGETVKYDGIYYLINYLRMQPDLLSLINIGSRTAHLNLVPVDFIVAAMTALADDERALGATLQLADPAPSTTYDLFETIARSLAGHGSRLKLPSPLVRSSLLVLPFSEAVTGLPRVGVPYFFNKLMYDATHSRRLLESHGLRCPPFATYVDAITGFVARHPKLKTAALAK